MRQPATSSRQPPATPVNKTHSMVKLLTRDPTVKLNHRALLCQTASWLDDWLKSPLPNKSPEEFSILKEKLSESEDLESLLTVLLGDAEIHKILCSEVNDIILAELVDVDSKTGPLSEFPPNINSNIYSRIAEFGMSRCPNTMAMLCKLAIKNRKSILPANVLIVANHFANLCYLTNKNLDGLVKLRSLTLQAGGLTDEALDMLSDMGLAETAHSLSNHKDLFAEVGPQVMLSTESNMPTTKAIDNLDFDKESLQKKKR